MTLKLYRKWKRKRALKLMAKALLPFLSPPDRKWYYIRERNDNNRKK